MPEPHDSEPPDRSSDEQTPDSTSKPESASDANPYHPPPSAGLESAEIPLAPLDGRRINYPGGLWFVLAFGLCAGILITAALAEMISWANGLGWVVPAVLWVSGFAALGAALRGTKQQRLRRAAILAGISFPAAILYVPVCTLGTVILMEGPLDGPSNEFSVGIGSTFAVFLVMTLAAVILRAVTRARMRRGYIPPSSSQDASPNE